MAKAAWLVIFACALASVACGPDRTFVSDDGGAADTGSDTQQGDTAVDTSVDAPGDTGVDTGVDTGPVDTGPAGKTGLGVVAGGATMKSATYTLITTTGAKQGVQGPMKSSTYTLKGGVVGATAK